MRRQRPQFSHHGAAGAAISRQPGCHPPHRGRRHQSVGRTADPGAAVGHRRHQAGVGRVLHLSRESGTLYSHQVQRARPRSGRRGEGCAAAHRQRGANAGRLSPGMGGRVRRVAGSARAAGHRHSDQPGADRHAALHQFLLAARHAAGRQRDAHGADRRHFRALSHRHAVQRFGGHRLCRPVRHFGDGRHHRAVLLQPHVDEGRRRAAKRSCAPAMCRSAR